MDQVSTDIIRVVLDGIKRESFSEGYKASDAEAMGLLLSRVLDYDGIAIMKAAEYGLEDANFHDACGKLREIRAAEEAPPPCRKFLAPSDSQRGRKYLVTLHSDGHHTCECRDFICRHRACKHIKRARRGDYGQML